MRIRAEDLIKKTSFTKQELLASAMGNLLEDPCHDIYPRLPAPPLLMFDRIVAITHHGRKGSIVAEQEIALDDWFFQCHFRQDPVQPGCLGVDAIWQLLGFYAFLRGAKGVGRALGAKEIEFFGQIRPHNKIVRYELTIKRYQEIPLKQATLIVGTGKVFVDGSLIYIINDAKVGTFVNIDYLNYPHQHANALGGKMIKEEV